MRRWRRRRRLDRSFKPIWSMFLFGLFLTIGLSPGSLIFNTAFDLVSPYITIAC
ncbi:MAG: hypothetical protein LLG16_08000 [Euryarchaeota archaeon]|nr:hypothetical protein [Euryarchaeota archaeon]